MTRLDQTSKDIKWTENVGPWTFFNLKIVYYCSIRINMRLKYGYLALERVLFRFFQLYMKNQQKVTLVLYTFLAHSCARMQAMNEYREGPNVDGSLWTKICGRKFVDGSLWTEVKVCSPPLPASAQ